MVALVCSSVDEGHNLGSIAEPRFALLVVVFEQACTGSLRYSFCNLALFETLFLDV